MAVKYVFVTGGVVAGLGKGITAASLGRLLKARGYTVPGITRNHLGLPGIASDRSGSPNATRAFSPRELRRCRRCSSSR